MKTVSFALLVAWVVILATLLEADAKRLTLVEVRKEKADANLGRKVNVGANDVKVVVSENKVSTGSTEKETESEGDDEPNGTHGLTKSDSRCTSTKLYYICEDKQQHGKADVKEITENKATGSTEKKNKIEAEDDKKDTVSKIIFENKVSTGSTEKKTESEEDESNDTHNLTKSDSSSTGNRYLPCDILKKCKNDVNDLTEDKATESTAKKNKIEAEDDKKDTISKGDSNADGPRYFSTDKPPPKNKNDNKNGR